MERRPDYIADPQFWIVNEEDFYNLNYSTTLGNLEILTKISSTNSDCILPKVEVADSTP